MEEKTTKNTRPAFIMFRRNSLMFWQLVQKRPTAFALLSVIAQRARFSTDPEVGVKGVKPGEALIGDHRNYGVSARQYRTDKEYLNEYGLATFRKTNRGTVALLLTSDIFDINVTGERQAKRRAGRQANDKPSDSKTTSKEEGKEGFNNVKEFYNTEPPAVIKKPFKERGQEDGNFNAVGELLKHIKIPSKPLLTNEWQEHASRVAARLGNTKLTGSWFKLFKEAHAKGLEGILESAASFCVDAPNVRDREKFFFWRFYELVKERKGGNG